ncbi:MAG: DNA topoisomerase (ATP-hydrolyzing) subunit B [Candidatus Moranbacteria bacterium CG23_combo_of_CG06-09_8_20_14_all_35_22]|nr:MAG: DNA topoisomerase (ATP-hydrolyzing) subunit B [Candidatus Moranbacteria bacterium CG23_combo_of_CG06-09_8_20_14_all_35_22]
MVKEIKKDNGEYTAKSIQVLEGLEPVRKRPGMYIGGTSTEGLHHLIWEVVNNSVDEAMAGYCKNIEVKLLPKNVVEITDDGRGIPVEKHPQTKKSTLETVLTVLHAGGKFGGNGYKISGGLHGVGVSVVNALSVYLKAQVKRDGKIYEMDFERGKPKSKEPKVVGKAKDTGTKIIFEADPQIFPEIEYNWEKILAYLRQQSYLTKGLSVKIYDEREENNKPASTRGDASSTRGGSAYGFLFDGGLVSYIKFLNRGKEIKNEMPFYVEKTVDDTLVEIAMQYTDSYKEHVFSFANNIFTPEGGMHEVGFRSALTRAINSYAKKAGILKEKDDNFVAEDFQEGLTAVISVKLRNPQFEGQTKAKLGNSEIRGIVSSVTAEALAEYLEAHPNNAKEMVAKIMLTSRARIAARAAKDAVIRKGALEGMTLPGKLADCSSRDASKTELYIVEGDSAGGCFFGNTKVALADGRNISFKELVKENQQGKKNFCYTIENDGNVGVAEIENPCLTKKKADVIKVILDNDEEIICTPDHKFMLKDGNYKKAQDLKKIDSLMPLYKKIFQLGQRITIKGYEMVFQPKSNKWMFTHILGDRYNLEKEIYLRNSGNTVHHKDFNKLNNNPDNLVRMPKRAHFDYHTKLLEKTLHRPDVKEFRKKRKEAYDKTYLEKGLRLMRSIYDKYKTVSEKLYDKERKELNDKSLIKMSTICERFFDGNEKKLEEAVLNFNHKIKSIEKLKKKVDVYDLEVSGTHNFALASGVFVHNSAKQGRDRRFQAILPLRGKLVNVEKTTLDKVVKSDTLKPIIIALGAGIGDSLDIAKTRYHRIIIMADADVDGSHIRTLLLTFFYRYFEPLIRAGYIYIAQPPLYRIQKGKEVQYCYTEEQKNIAVDKIIKASAEKADKKEMAGKNIEPEVVMETDINEEGESEVGEKIAGINLQRYKGLGEMNPTQLWETTMDPVTRLMLQVTIEDAESADKMFDVLMGSEVEPRRRFIQTHAKSVKNLDV